MLSDPHSGCASPINHSMLVYNKPAADKFQLKYLYQHQENGQQNTQINVKIMVKNSSLKYYYTPE